MASAMQVARHLEGGGQLPEMKLQKLLYYAQAWSLAWTGKALFPEEIEAWKDGPVVRSVWVARHHDTLAAVPGAPLTAAEAAMVDAVSNHYGRLSGPQLSARTHAEAPWLEARGGLGTDMPSRRPISQQTMRRTYTEQAIADGSRTPIAPSISSAATDASLIAAAARQRKRWRKALDILAER